jgi:hypothetical protein
MAELNPMSSDSLGFLDAINLLEAHADGNRETFTQIFALYEGHYEDLARYLGMLAGDMLWADRHSAITGGVQKHLADVREYEVSGKADQHIAEHMRQLLGDEDEEHDNG